MGDKTSSREPSDQVVQANNTPEERKRDPFEDSITSIAGLFPSLTTHQWIKLDDLAAEFNEQDETWATSIVEGLIEVALGACGAKAGELLLNRLVKGAEHSLKEEFAKGLFEEGAKAGVSRAKSELKGPKADVGVFIRAQKAALDDMNTASMLHFNHVGRYELKTLGEAQQLEAAMAAGVFEDAGTAAHDISRDLWVSRLAQAKFGTATYDNERRPSTNMSTQHMRDDANHAAPGWEPEDAPSLQAGVMGDAPGVLEIRAQLPNIAGNEMHGTPSVDIAFLDGVNETIRRQYAGSPLSELKIPRQIHCVVDGDMPEFTINIDEHGRRYGSLRHHESAWLRARALVGHPENSAQGEVQQEEAGLRLLLADLVPTSIKRGLL